MPTKTKKPRKKTLETLTMGRTLERRISVAAPPDHPGRAATLDPAGILTPEELAGRLKVPKSWVYEKTRSRSLDPLPSIRLGKYLRFYWPDVVSWMARH